MSKHLFKTKQLDIPLHGSVPFHGEGAEVERFYEDLQDLLKLTPKKDVFFIIVD